MVNFRILSTVATGTVDHVIARTRVPHSWKLREKIFCELFVVLIFHFFFDDMRCALIQHAQDVHLWFFFFSYYRLTLSPLLWLCLRKERNDILILSRTNKLLDIHGLNQRHLYLYYTRHLRS